jgi:GntR family transcriptional regulator/MocR family aminotransferase
MRTLYKSRREALVESLNSEFGSFVEIHGSEAGMHLSLTLPEGYDDIEIATRAAKEKLWLWPLSPCWTGAGARPGFILGYGNTPAEQMKAEAARLRKIVAP